LAPQYSYTAYTLTYLVMSQPDIVPTWRHNSAKSYFKITSCFISHVTTSETEVKLFQPLKEFRNYFFFNYFSDIEHVRKYSWAAI